MFHPTLPSLLLLLSGGVAAAGDLPDPPPPIAASAAPDLDDPTTLLPPARPTRVEVAVRLVGLTRVDPPNESFPTFTAELLLQTSWVDPRLRFDPATTGGEPRRYHGHLAELKLDRIWEPDLAIENEEGARTVEHREIDHHPDGRIRYVERSKVDLHADMDLRRFPFDRQALAIRIAPFSWDADHVTLAVAPGGLTHADDHGNFEWEVLGLDGQVATRETARMPRPVSVLEAAVQVERIPGFYLYKLLVPLVLIVVFTWSAFWMRAEPSAGRMQRTFVALLTVVAFHHIVAGHLPKIAYLTFVDAVVYAAFLSVGATLLQVVRIHNAQHAGDAARVERLERLGRWGHPVGFAVVILALWAIFHAL